MLCILNNLVVALFYVVLTLSTHTEVFMGARKTEMVQLHYAWSAAVRLRAGL
jgi:hypothetical protein